MNYNALNQENTFDLADCAASFRMKLMRELLGDVNGKLAVDIGCGNGDMSFLLWLLGARVHSFDVSTKALQATRNLRRLSECSAQFENSLCQGDAMRLPFREGVFDIVCSLETIGLLPDDRTAIKEIARVMKSDGTAILAVPYYARATKEKTSGRYKRYSLESIKERLDSKQLRLEQVVFWRFPMLELLDLMRVRYVFAALGLLIETLSGEDNSFHIFRSLQNYEVFIRSLKRFYRTRFWHRVLPLLMFMLDLNRLFLNSPYSNDAFLIFRKAQ